MSPDRAEIHPEILASVQPQIEIPRDKRGRIRWALLPSDDRVIIIRQEAQALLSNGRTLTATDAPGLMVNVRKYYPSGLNALKIDLNQSIVKKPDGYWTPERIETAAKEFMGQTQNFTAQALIKAGRSDLAVAAGRRYPGGIRALKEKLGLPTTRPQGYWKNPANIEAEARRFITTGEPLVQTALLRMKMSSLAYAIQNHYPGGLEQLRANLELSAPRKPIGYWTPKTIEQEASEFYQAHGELTTNGLRENNRNDLNSAIYEDYPGHLRALKEKLGIKLRSKPRGYWQEAEIEKEALEFYTTEGTLTQKALIAKKRFDLSNAILRNYPGRFRGLKQKLSLVFRGAMAVISAEDANEQLRRLVDADST